MKAPRKSDLDYARGKRRPEDAAPSAPSDLGYAKSKRQPDDKPPKRVGRERPRIR